jgi:hypothetical protein
MFTQQTLTAIQAEITRIRREQADDDQAGTATHTFGKGPHRGLLRDLNSTLGRVRVRYQTMQTTGNVIYNLER